MSITLDQSQQFAADELIAVTGDKTIKRTWDLADAIIAASPQLIPQQLARIRQGAVAKAGHDEFWQVGRLRQLGATAQKWPVSDRIADVSLDAHMEAYRKLGSTGASRAVLLKIKKADPKGEVSIRAVRKELGANGTAAAPPRVDKAEADELWRRLISKQAHLKKHLRGRLIEEQATILAFASMFNDLVGMLNKVKGVPEQSPDDTPDQSTQSAAAPVARRRRKSI